MWGDGERRRTQSNRTPTQIAVAETVFLLSLRILDDLLFHDHWRETIIYLWPRGVDAVLAGQEALQPAAPAASIMAFVGSLSTRRWRIRWRLDL